VWQIAVKEAGTIRPLGLTEAQPGPVAEHAHCVLVPSLLLAHKRVVHLDGLVARRELEKVRGTLQPDYEESVRICCVQKALKVALHVGECATSTGVRHGVTCTE